MTTGRINQVAIVVVVTGRCSRGSTRPTPDCIIANKYNMNFLIAGRLPTSWSDRQQDQSGVVDTSENPYPTVLLCRDCIGHTTPAMPEALTRERGQTRLGRADIHSPFPTERKPPRCRARSSTSSTSSESRTCARGMPTLPTTRGSAADI